MEDIIKEMESAGKEVPRDAFGHPKLDAVCVLYVCVLIYAYVCAYGCVNVMQYVCVCVCVCVCGERERERKRAIYVCVDVFLYECMDVVGHPSSMRYVCMCV